jgi:hypothetical protein
VVKRSSEYDGFSTRRTSLLMNKKRNEEQKFLPKRLFAGGRRSEES